MDNIICIDFGFENGQTRLVFVPRDKVLRVSYGVGNGDIPADCTIIFVNGDTLHLRGEMAEAFQKDFYGEL